MTLGLFVQYQPPELWDLVKEIKPPVMLYLNPEAGKVPHLPPVTVGRIYFDGEAQRLASDPVAFGHDAAAACIASARATGIPLWMGTNEPDVGSTAAMERLVAFETEFTRRLNAEGLRAAVFSLSVGWPRQIDGTNKLDTAPLDAFLKTLHPMNVVAVHEYFTPNGVYQPFMYPDGNTVVPYTEDGPSLCWRFNWWPQIDNHYVLVTETGMDIWGRPETDGWRAQTPPGMNLEQWFDRYVAMQTEYINLVSQDARFLGATWFCAGPGYGWGNYDVIDHWRQAKALLSEPAPELPDSAPTPVQTIRVKVGATDEVRVIPVETYLEAVTPAEMPALWPTDAVMAQAVWARSVALARVADPRADAYDISDSDQVYNPEMTHPASTRAVQETVGVHLHRAGTDWYAHYVSKCGQSANICPYCKGAPGWVTTDNPSGVWPGRACQYGAQTMALAGKGWREIALAYYDGEEVVLSDDSGQPDGDSGGDDPPEGDNMSDPYLPIDSRIPDNLKAHQFVNNVVYGSVVRIVDSLEAWKRWGHTDMPVGGALYWKVDYLAFIDEVASQGKTAIYVSCVDETGIAMPAAKVWFGYPSERLQNDSWVGKFDNGGGNGDVFVYPAGSGEIAQGQNSFLNVANGSTTVGPYCIGIQQDGPSDVAAGFGLTNNRHVCYAVRFRRAKWGGDTPTPPEPDGCIAGVLQAILNGLKK